MVWYVLDVSLHDSTVSHLILGFAAPIILNNAADVENAFRDTESI